MREPVAQTRDWFSRLAGEWQLRRRIVQWGPKHGLADGLGNGAGSAVTNAAGNAATHAAVNAAVNAADPMSASTLGRLEAGASSPISSPRVLPEAVVAGRLTGIARFTPIDQATLHYCEQGTLTLRQPGRRPESTTVHAVREYRYRCDASAWTIDFADGPNAGEQFLRLDPINVSAHHAASDDRDEIELHDVGLAAAQSDWVAIDHHLCGRDLYQAVYRLHGFARPDRASHRIVQRTTVTGPRKDYAIVSVLRRAPDRDLA